MKQRCFFLLALSFFLIASAAFGWERQFFVKGQINASINKSLVVAGDTLTLTVTMNNLSNFPLAKAYLVMDLVNVNRRAGPKTFFYENTFLETKSTYYFLRPHESKTVALHIKIPAYVPDGNYLLNLYFKTPREFITGIPFIFVYPYSVPLKVLNSGTVENVVIDRENTKICGPLSEQNFKYSCYAGPVGVIVKPGESKLLHVAIKNNGPSEPTLTLKLLFYPYDDTVGGTAVEEITTHIGKLQKKGTWTKDISFLSPKKPGAYVLRMELYDSDKHLLSLFRSRINVKGVSTRIIALHADKIFYKKGSTVTIESKVLSPADANSFDKNCSLYLSVEENGKQVYSTKHKLALTQKVPLQIFNFSFQTDRPLYNFIIRESISDSNGSILDSYVAEFPYADFSRVLSSFNVFIGSDSNFTKQSTFLAKTPIYMKVEAQDEYGNPITAETTLYFISGDREVGPIKFKGTYVLKKGLPPGTYSLLFSAYNKSLKKTISVVAPKQLVVQISDTPNFNGPNTTSFELGKTIYINTYLVGATGASRYEPVTLYITNNKAVVGPTLFEGTTELKNLLPGRYILTFSSAGIKETRILDISNAFTQQSRTPSPSYGQTMHQNAFANPFFVIISIAVILIIVLAGVLYIRMFYKK